MDAEDKLEAIRLWCDAYPLDIFPEPDLKKARKLLEAGGMTLDVVSASNMRHVLDGIRKIIEGGNMMTEIETSKLQEALATAMEAVVNEPEQQTTPAKTVRLMPNESPLVDQFNRIDSIQRQIRDKVRRRRMDLMLELETRSAEIKAEYTKRLLAAEEIRDMELRRLSDSLRKEFEDLSALDARLKGS